MSRQFLATAAMVLLAGARLAGGDEVRYVQEGGVLYRETHRVVQRPIVETQTQETTRTVYREQATTEMRDTVRTCWTPVTEYQCEAYVANRWNPLATPYLTYRMVPRTRWECRNETVKVPVTTRSLVPETQTVRKPVTVCRMEKRALIDRVAVGRPASSSQSVVSQPPAATVYQQIGGVARLDRDPPREGISTAWRPSATPR
jgi:hypothetical protein